MVQRSKRKLAMASFLLVVVASLFSSVAQIAQVAMGVPTATADGGMAVTVTLASGSLASVAAVQFDLQYDPNQYGFAQATVGDAAVAAGKDAVYSEPAPGVVRVIVAGLNQDTVSSGSIATLYFLPTGKVAGDTSFAMESSLANVVVSDPVGGKNDVVVAEAASSSDTSNGDATLSRSSASRTATSASNANSQVNDTTSKQTSAGVLPSESSHVTGTNSRTSASTRVTNDTTSTEKGALSDEAPIPARGAEGTTLQQGVAEGQTPAEIQTNSALAKSSGASAETFQTSRTANAEHDVPSVSARRGSAARMQIAKTGLIPSRSESRAVRQTNETTDSTECTVTPAVYWLMGGTAILAFLVFGTWVLKRT